MCKVVVRVCGVDPYNGGITYVSPIRLAHDDVVEGMSARPAVGALERMFHAAFWGSEVGVDEEEYIVSCEAEESLPVPVHRVMHIETHDTGIAAPVVRLSSACGCIHHNHNMIAARPLPYAGSKALQKESFALASLVSVDGS